MKQIWTAVLHIKYKDPISVYQLAGKVYANISATKCFMFRPVRDGRFQNRCFFLPSLCA